MTEPMNTAQIAAMVADREAGTPGKWVVGFRDDGSSYLSIGGLEPGQAHSQGNIFFHTDYPRDIANARRVSRVSDFEVTIIGQAAEITRLTAECIALQGNATHNYELWNSAKAKVAALTDVLRRIAAYDDKNADAHLFQTGSYGAFDEPNAVRTARAALGESL